MRTYALSAQQYQIKVAEQGFAVSVTELLLNASFDDVMASASRLLGRNMALYLDTQARTSLQRSTSAAYGYDTTAMPINVQYGIYNAGTPGTSGYREVAIVYPGEANQNSGPNPDNPAHFTCGVPHS